MDFKVFVKQSFFFMLCLATFASADIVNRYSFLDGSAGLAYDSVGQKHGTLQDGAFIQDGRLILDGTNDYVSLPSDTLSDYSSLTIESWFNLDGFNSWQRIFDFGDISGGSGGYYLTYTPSSYVPDSRLILATNGFPGYLTGEQLIIGDVIPVNVPTYVACVYDNTSSQMKLYENGLLVDSIDVTMELTDVAKAYAYLGKSLYSLDAFLHGSIDEFRIYDSVLTDEEIALNYAYGPDALQLDRFLFDIPQSGLNLYSSNLSSSTSYSIALKEAPTDSVDVILQIPIDLNIGNGIGQSLTLTFTPQNWQQLQTVNITFGDTPTSGEYEVNISYSIQSNDITFDNLFVYDTVIKISEDSCGNWGYLENDYNFDCIINLLDYAYLGNLWLRTDSELDFESFFDAWLNTNFDYDPQQAQNAIQKSNQPFFVDTSNIVNRIDEKVYGHFLEHIYHSVNNGLWGDIVWNRSFEMFDGDGNGNWSIEGDVISQHSLGTNIRLPFGQTQWTDYEITLQARRNSGSEGFLVMFRSDGNNFYWYNFGGWSNTLHALQKGDSSGGWQNIGSSVAGSVNTGQWYDIRIRCEANNYKIWLNESLLYEYTDNDSPYLTGQAGLATWSTNSSFRNIMVKNLAGDQILYQGLPDVPLTQMISDNWNRNQVGTYSVDSDALNGDTCIRFESSIAGAGVQQTPFNFTVQPYIGLVWLKGSALDGLLVEFLDGQTVIGQQLISAVTNDWAEYNFEIIPSAPTLNGTLRISSLGGCNLLIDQVSVMPQDSIDNGGFRTDLLDAVNGLRPPIIRWPGGCYASAYRWKDGIGSQHTRNKYQLNLWEDQDTNSYGTDEFLRMCEMVGAEPLIVINVGVLDVTCGVGPIEHPSDPALYIQEAMEWIEYCNGSIDTTWGAVRAANGHPEPYNVKYWEIDNEVWLAGTAAYNEKIKQFVPAMKSVDPDIKILACGSGSYDMNWNRDILDECAELIDYISIHHYENENNFKNGPRDFENFIAQLGDVISESANPNVKIYMSEWNAQSIDWRTGMYAGSLINGFERQGEVFEIGGPALFLRHLSASAWNNSFINFDHTGWFPAPNYVVMKLWWDHFAPNRLDTTGGDTNLNVVSTLSDDGEKLYIKIVNPDNLSKDLEFEIDSGYVPSLAYMHYVAPGDLYASNNLGNKEAVSVSARVIGIDGQSLKFRMPAYSAGVITVETNKPISSEYKPVYMFSSFRDNGQDGLHLSYSTDGYNYTALKGDQSFLAPAVGGNLMRDPSISQGPDGTFHMVWTTGWWDNGIGIAHSTDLINWSAQTFLSVMQDEPDTLNCWAPEIFYDNATDDFLIFWASTIPGKFPETDLADDDNNHRIYYVRTRDFVNYSETELFYEHGFNVIDSFVIKDKNKYLMFLKHESKYPVVEKNIRIAYSDFAQGPYSEPSDPITPGWVEGPSITKVGSDLLLYYDAYTAGEMNGKRSSDSLNWSDISDQLNFPNGTRHGTVFKVTTNVLDALLQE